MKIYVAGHRGLVGSAIVRKIESQNLHTWVGKTHAELDLRDRNEVLKYLASEKPDAVIIAAAKVGGIKANAENPVEFLSHNLQIQTNLLDGCHENQIERVLFLGSSCVYPKFSPQPIKEEYLLSGELEKTNEPYAIAKIAGLKLVQAYRKQYGHNWISAMPTNLYGPFDNYDLNNSHVLPALLAKFHLAKLTNAKQVEVWGSGAPLREFLHSDDLASACIFLLEKYNDEIPINIGTGEEISIKSLAKLVSEIVDFHGELKWNRTKPDGTPRKLLNTERLTNLGWKPEISLAQGIKQTYASYLLENSNVRPEGIK